MTSTTTSLAAARPRPTVRLTDRPALFAWLLMFPLALSLSWPQAVMVWQTGSFVDTDQAMRAVEIRNWLAGQSWFDLVQHRLDPSHSLPTHWTRVLDVPIGAMMRLFGLFTDAAHAERLARILFPLCLQSGLILATAKLADALAGPRAAIAAAVLLVASGMSFGRFSPGDIDHHGTQILLVVLITGAAVRAFDPAQARQAGLLGALCVLSLSISLETLPFIAILIAAPALCWAAGGRAYRRTLMFEALGIAVAAPLLYAGLVSPSAYGTAACDTYSAAHAVGLLAGAAALAALSALTPWLTTMPRRALALAAAGIGLMSCIYAAFPACLSDPYGALDPLIRDLWLKHVTEAQPLWLAASLRPGLWLLLVCPALACAVATAAALGYSRGLVRGRWCLLSALVLMGFAGTLWELRVAAFVQPLVLLGGAWALARCADAVERGGARIPRLAICFVLACAFSPLAWIILPSPGMSAETAAAMAGSAACRQAEALEPLAGLPPGLAFAPIELGAHLIAYTDLSVLAAPYHRNRHGNRLVLDGFLAPPDEARDIVRNSGARYIIVCSGELHLDVLAKAAPGGLAAALRAGHVPDWLVPVPLGASLYRVFALREPGSF